MVGTKRSRVNLCIAASINVNEGEHFDYDGIDLVHIYDSLDGIAYGCNTELSGLRLVLEITSLPQTTPHSIVLFNPQCSFASSSREILGPIYEAIGVSHLLPNPNGFL